MTSGAVGDECHKYSFGACRTCVLVTDQLLDSLKEVDYRVIEVQYG